MPYLTFATQNSAMTNSMKPFKDVSQVIHGSRTLDEYYYQFASDKDYQQEDIDKRNRDQVVTRWLHRGEGIDDLQSWVVLRVDQLWLWVIAPGKLRSLRSLILSLILLLALTRSRPDVIITSSTHRLDGRPDVVSSSVFSHLQKGHSQPKTVHELADLITTICIRFYDQTQEMSPEKSIPMDGTQQKPKLKKQGEGGGLTIQEIFQTRSTKWFVIPRPPGPPLPPGPS